MKRILSAVVCLAMVLTMLPAVALLSAQAAEEATYTYVTPTPASIIPADNGTKGAWYINGSTFVTTPGSANYIEIVADGYADTGALHVYQDNVANNDMSLGMYLGGQPAGTYTVKMYVKGDLGHMGQVCRFYPYGCIDQAPNLHNALGTTDVADWTEVSYQINATSDFYYFIFTFSKYNWKSDFYVDNLQLINSSGVNVLGNAGSFYELEEVTTTGEESGMWPDSTLLDLTQFASAYKAFSGVWTPMYRTGQPEADTTWPAWDGEHYAEFSPNGYKDPGSIHLVSAPKKNTAIAINAGMTPGQTYTLGFYAKGTVNTGKVMGMYDNGGGTIIADTASFLPGWNYYEHTFTANLSQLNIVAADWGWVDIYVDNITLTDATGKDLLAGCGDFYTTDSLPSSTVVTLDTTKLDDVYDAPEEWVPFSPYAEYKLTWPTWEAGVNYGEIVEAGYQDAGALHLVSAAGKNTGVVINPGMVSGQQYTIGMWVKGTASSNKMLAIYNHGDPCLIGNPNHCGDVCLSAVPAEWTYIEKTFTAKANSLPIFAVDWGTTDIYIDNITLTDATGKDLLAGYGDFCVKEPEALLKLETTTPVSAYNAPNGQWAMMYPSGTAGGTWPAWDDTHYGQIVKSGYADAGALHMVSAPGMNTGVGIGVDMVTGETYTLGLWAKGTSNSGRVLLSYSNNDAILIGASSELTAEWTYYEVSFVCTTTQLNIVAVDWGVTDIYIDNITLTDASGKDLLAGYGDFCVKEMEEPEEPTVPEYQPPTEEGWIGRDEYTQLQLGVDYDYSFAVLGDLQHITDYTPSDLHYLFDYILDNKDTKNIQFVFGMGDTTNDNHNEANNLKEWKLAQEQFFRFNDVLPYTVVRGNHDVVTRMNAYFADPAKPGYTDQLDGFYQEGSVVNVWKEFSVAGVDYLSLLIDYESSDSVLAWASDVIASHPHHP